MYIQSTWRSKLINRFKNSRKGSKRKLPNDSNNDSVDEPPNKVAKRSTPSRFYLHPKGESLPEAEYEKLVYQLKVEFTEKSHPKSKTMKSLMDDTFTTRRRWIVDEQPKVVEVLAKFPFLNSERWVSLNTDLHVHTYADVHVQVYSYLCMYVYTE